VNSLHSVRTGADEKYMFIVWGFFVFKRTLSSGTFMCPHERTQCEYRLRSRKKWFHIMFIPLVPSGDLGNVVHCGSCKKMWQPSVLNQAQRAQPAAPNGPLPQFAPALLMAAPVSPVAAPSSVDRVPAGQNAMAEVIRGTNIAVLRTITPDPASRENAVHSIAMRYPTYDYSALNADIAHLDISDLGHKIEAVRPLLEPDDVEAMLRRLMRVAVGSGSVLQEQSHLLIVHIGNTFELAPDRVLAIVGSMRQPVALSA
jgi:hypothetical protein